MSFLTILGLAFALAMDAFAVAVATGICLPKLTFRHVFRLAFHFGLFQFFMPVIGWVCGNEIAIYISDYDHWIAFVLLGYVGGKMLYEFNHEAEGAEAKDPTRGKNLIFLSIATSIDALAVGLSIAFLNISVWYPSIVIGLVAALITAIGITFGCKLGSLWGKVAKVLGGIILISIGAKILSDHLNLI